MAHRAELIVARVPYLNCEPFYAFWGESPYRLLPVSPRRLGELAAEGQIAAGPMASYDAVRLEDQYEPLADLGVAVREEAGSVLLFSRRPLSELNGRTVSITEETATSFRLLRLILEVRHGIHPAGYQEGKGGDALLYIGDWALRRRQAPGEYPVITDLGREWWEWRELPFIFARWMVQQSLPADGKTRLGRHLEAAFEKGESRLEEVAARRGPELGLKASQAESYLRNFTYRLGAEELEGLRTFRRLLDEHGID